MMEVRLAPAGRASGEQCERTFTDNISPHGIRVKSSCAWKLGERVKITSGKEEGPMLGQVIYCHKAGPDRYFVGLRFPAGRIPWSILQRFNGLAHTEILGAMRWSDQTARPLEESELNVVRKRGSE